MSFSALGLRAELLLAVGEQGYTEPTPIQAQAIPAVLAGRDLMGGAQTGTGKTAGFVLPILQKLAEQTGGTNNRTSVRALILVPTRELAAQVQASVFTYGKHLPKLRSLSVYGGVGFHPQVQALKRGIDILVATPGRLLDHLSQRTVDLSKVQVLVLDEADRMLDMGFIPDIRKILAYVPKQRQNLLFSATFSDEIKKLADGFMHDPLLIEVARRNATAELIAQRVCPVDREKKKDLLAHLITTGDWKQVLVFTRTKHGANNLAEKLVKSGIRADAIHGNKSQPARTRALAEFKAGKIKVLVATDIAARGLDIDELPHVVNFELPHVANDYVHRIGRTGRAGSSGEAVSLVCVDELGLLRDIERLIKREIKKEIVPGFEVDPRIRAEPIVQGKRGSQQQRRPSSAPRKAGAGAPHKAGNRGQHAPRQPAGRAGSRSSRDSGRRTSAY
ncbi:MAG: DEAD/DEAH box helicase [Proteobacteria bacterium]|nr:DEAD/DEAH box helicase [Pseudomonadota bacterium]